VGRPSQEPPVRPEALGNALGVVEAIDREEDAASLEAATELPKSRPHRLVALQQAHERLGSDADGAGLELHRPPLEKEPVHAARQTQDPEDGGAEVGEVPVGLKGGVVGPQHTEEELLAVGEDPEDLRRREGDVEEEADRHVGHRFPEEAGKQHEVVVVHPDEIPGLETVDYGVAEAVVGLDIGLPASRGVLQERRELVEQRPEGLVRVALVETGGEGAGEVHRDEAALALPAVQSRLAFEVGSLGTFPRPAEPQSSGALDDRPEGGDEAPGARLTDPPVGRAPQGQRETVRDDDQTHAAHDPWGLWA
jgi:hypothetical protein